MDSSITQEQQQQQKQDQDQKEQDQDQEGQEEEEEQQQKQKIKTKDTTKSINKSYYQRISSTRKTLVETLFYFITLIIFVYYIYYKYNKYVLLDTEVHFFMNTTTQLHAVECSKPEYVRATHIEQKCMDYKTVLDMNVEQVVANKFLNDFWICKNNTCSILSTVVSGKVLIIITFIVFLLYILLGFFIRMNQIERRALNFHQLGYYTDNYKKKQK